MLEMEFVHALETKLMMVVESVFALETKLLQRMETVDVKVTKLMMALELQIVYALLTKKMMAQALELASVKKVGLDICVIS